MLNFESLDANSRMFTETLVATACERDRLGYRFPLLELRQLGT